ncbi:MAG: phosphoglycerate mutase family protein [Acidiferrobacterales bacterium]|nr:phosphoglycerate mutase family protein [Acidiferrobacterales bacterium]
MASIYLIRHGQASFGKDNYDELSELGHQQSRHLGQALSRRLPDFDQVVLGSMWRHEQTARNCLSNFDTTFDRAQANVDPRWNEYDHQQILRVYRPEFVDAASMMKFVRQQDNPKAFFEQEFNAAIDRWMAGEHDADYDESWVDFQQRVHKALATVTEVAPRSGSIAVFTSGGPISLLSQALLGVPADKLMQMNWTLMNCGVTKIVTTGSRNFLASLNEHSHFEGTDKKHLITYT